MRRFAERYGRGGRRTGARALAALALAAAMGAAAGVAGAAEVDELAQQIDESYRVLPTRQGLLLEPREEVPGIQTIEIAAGEVAINGEPVAPTILRSWLGEQAEPLLALAALPEDEARSLLAPPEAADEEEAADDELADDAADPLDESEVEALAEPAPEPFDEEAGEEPRIQLGERVIFGRTLTIDEDEVASEVVVIGGAVHVLGRVDRGVVAVGGPVIVEGRVRGDVVSVGGGVQLGPDAEIRGEVVSVGGSVRARDDQIGRGVVEIGFPWSWDGDWGWEPRWGRRDTVRHWAAREAVGNVIVILLLGLMTAFLLLVARGTVERGAAVIARQPGSSLLSGLAMWIFQLIGIWVLAAVLVVTIVGCLALPLVPVLWLFGWLLYLPGYAAAALATGRWLGARFGWGLGGSFGTALAGVLVIEWVRLLGNVLAIAGGPFAVIGTLIELTGILIALAAWTVGVGAVLMNLLNRRRPPAHPLPPGPLPSLPAGGEGGAGGAAAVPTAAPAAGPAPPPPVTPGPVDAGPATPPPPAGGTVPAADATPPEEPPPAASVDTPPPGEPSRGGSGGA